MNAVKEIGVWFVDGKFKVQNDVCVDDVCVTKEEFKAMLLRGKSGGSGYSAPSPVPLVTPTPDPVPENPVDVVAEPVVETVPIPEVIAPPTDPLTP